MKIFLSTLISIFMVHVSVDAQNQFDPLLLYFSRHTPGLFSLPINKIPSVSDENIKTLCPAETDPGKRNLNTISATFPQAKYCLFRKDFLIDQPKYCTEQPKPWLELQLRYEGDETSCGPSSEHREFRIGFYVCGTSVQLEYFQKKSNEPADLVARFQRVLNFHASGHNDFPQFHGIYNLCIDTSNGKTVWTKHEIMTPKMFTDDEEKLKRESEGDTDISTDPIRFEADTFIAFKQKFHAQNEESYKMTENFMVPREHVALKVWRNAVNHFINVAPLWDNLKKLMITVDQAIKKIAQQLDTIGQQLTVYNKAIDSKEVDDTLIQVNGQFSSTVWYKFLYEYKSHTAAFIVLHNTPNSPPEVKACETEMICDVKKWREKNNDDDADEDISAEIFKYVYCCNPSSEEVEKIFHQSYEIKGPLNLDEFFNKPS